MIHFTLIIQGNKSNLSYSNLVLDFDCLKTSKKSRISNLGIKNYYDSYAAAAATTATAAATNAYAAANDDGFTAATTTESFPSKIIQLSNFFFKSYKKL